MRDPDLVGTHGSNLSKAQPFRADPRLDGHRCLTERIVVSSGHLAIPEVRPSSLCSCGQQLWVLFALPEPRRGGLIIAQGKAAAAAALG